MANVYFATAQPSDPASDLFVGHEYEGSPGGYIHSPDVDNPMEAAILIMGLLLEVANTAPHNAFDGLMVIYESDLENPEPSEYLAFKLNLQRTTQEQFHSHSPL
jgi:hypothetical protein